MWQVYDLGREAGTPHSLGDTPLDPNLVDWSPDDPERPMNWPSRTIWANLAIISFFRLLTPLASSMIAPATALVLHDFHSADQSLGSFVVSIFVLGYALGPLAWAPLSEIYGRLPVYHISNILFTCWNIGCALAPNLPSLLVFRLLAGMAGSCPVTVGSGSITDCIPKERRGKATAIFTVGPLLGPVLGPVIGGFLSEARGWRSVFWFIAIASAICALISFLVQRETYEPVLLERRAKRLRAVSGNSNIHHRRSAALPRSAVFSRAILRPLVMLVKSPIVLLTSFYVGLVYGYSYLLFTSFSALFTHTHGFSASTVGLTYLGFGCGCAIGLLIVGTVSDKMTRHAAAGVDWKPEARLRPLIPGSLIVPIGLLWYGWSAQARLHWIMPIIGSALVGLGTVAVVMPVQTYLIDAFPLHAASVSAANTIFRSLLGAFLPLIGPRMYATLGQGWGNTLLAVVAVVFTPLTWTMVRRGEDLRRRWPV